MNLEAGLYKVELFDLIGNKVLESDMKAGESISSKSIKTRNLFRSDL
jgi:hypothetical protein